MKVLICGEYGIYCRELITRLKKENHDIFVITGSEKNRREKPRNGVFQEYNFSYRSKNVCTVMKNIKADIMIILGICDTKYTWRDTGQESVRYLTGVTNLLMSAREAGIRQVIYCSSLGVYENTGGGMIDNETEFEAGSVLMQTVIQTEYMCEEQNRPGEFQISVIRYPEIYGDYKTHDYNVCSRIMERFWGSPAVEIEAERQHRILYVKDAADVLVRVFMQEEKESCYLIPGTVYTERQILEAVENVVQGRKTDVRELEYTKGALPAVGKDSNEKLGLYEKYSLEDGLRELFKIYEKEKELEIREETKKSVVREKLIPLAENIGLFFIVTILYYLLKDTWLGSILDFYLIYVVVIAVVYGCAHSLFAALLTLLARIGEVFLVGETFEYAAFTGLLQILIIGVLVGYMRDKYKRSNGDLEDEKKYYESELVDMTRIYDGNRYVKEIYEKRLVNYENSMVRIYEVASRLDFWEPQKVIFQAVDVVSELMEMEDAAVYITGGNSDYMRLAAASSERARELGKSLYAGSDFFMHQELVERTVYRNREIDSKLPAYACGIYEKEKLSAVIMLWTKDLTKVNLYEANTLALICRLIESSMNHATTYWNMLADQYIEGTDVLREEEFNRIEEIYKGGAAENKLEYAMLKVPGKLMAGRNEAVYKKVCSLVRQTDILGEKAGDLYIILANTSRDEAGYVMSRFQNAGIQVDSIVG